MFGIFVQYSTRPFYDDSVNLFCWPPSVDIFNTLPGFLWQPLLIVNLRRNCRVRRARQPPFDTSNINRLWSDSKSLPKRLINTGTLQVNTPYYFISYTA